MITYQDIKHNENIRTYIERADRSLIAQRYTLKKVPDDIADEILDIHRKSE